MLLEGHRLCCDALEAATSAAEAAEESAAALEKEEQGGAMGMEGVPLPETVFVSPGAFDAPEGPRLRRVLERLPHGSVVTTTEEVLGAIATTETPQAVCAVLPYVHLKNAQSDQRSNELEHYYLTETIAMHHNHGHPFIH